MISRIFLCAALASGLTACAVNTPVDMTPTGGSKADGTVLLSYQFNTVQRPVINWPAETEKAARKCRAWGYSSAERFGGTRTRCVDFNEFGCSWYEGVAVFQCLD